MKSAVLTIFVLFIFVASAQSIDKVNKALTIFLNDADLQNASVSFNVVNLANGSVVSSYQPLLGIPPASTTKLFSTSAALQVLGKNYSPITRLYYTGKIDSNGVLNGNIIVRGGGDPTLGSTYFNDAGKEREFLNDWSQEIQALGIKLIKGGIIADASEFGYDGVPAGWTWGDMGNYYGAGPSGLNIFDNMASLYFSTGNSIGNPTHLDSLVPSISGLNFDNRVVTDNVRGDHSYIYGAPFSNDWFAKGTLPLNDTSFCVKSAIPDPELLIANELDKSLKSAGISIENNPIAMRKVISLKNEFYTDTTLILNYKSHTINEIVNITNLKSVNLFAEQLLCLVGWKLTKEGSTENSVQALESYWSSRIDIKGIRLTDGSGLSRNNAIASQHFTNLLTYMNNQSDKSFENSLPIAGKTGTLTNVCKHQAGEGKIIAKSGTMSRIKSYAGYVYTASGKKLALALIVNNYTCSSSALVHKMEYIFNAMALL